MTYKEVLFFVAQSLTIHHNARNRSKIEAQLRSNTVDWDAVVQLSTAHYVFPALYCNLKKVNFLGYVPKELLAFMKHLTQLNRERNQQIIIQAKEINSLLRKNNITPIFLKGTGNLLEGLYEDIAERMVGDIDLIVPKIDFFRTINVLKTNGYYEIENKLPEFHRHYPSMVKRNNIAAIEIHKEVIIEKYINEFSNEFIHQEAKEINGCFVLSFSQQICISGIASQVNDYGHAYNKIPLRNAYDVFLLSKKADSVTSIANLDKLFDHLNCFLAICYKIFGKDAHLGYTKNNTTDQYLKTFDTLLKDENFRKKHAQKTARKLFLNARIEILSRVFIDKPLRLWLWKRLRDPKWQTAKLVQLGLKKTWK